MNGKRVASTRPNEKAGSYSIPVAGKFLSIPVEALAHVQETKLLDLLYQRCA